MSSWTKIFKNPLTTGLLTGAATATVAAISDPKHFNAIDPTSWANLGSVALAGAITGALAHRMPTARQETDKAVVEALVRAYVVYVMVNSSNDYIGVVPAFGISVKEDSHDNAIKSATVMLRTTITGRIINGEQMPTPDAAGVVDGAVSVTDSGLDNSKGGAK